MESLLLDLLLDGSLRVIPMAAGTAAALRILRIQTAAARHRAWTGVLVAMLLLPALTAWGPKWSVPVLPAARESLLLESVFAPNEPARADVRVAPPAVVSQPIPAAAPVASRKAWEWNWGWIALVIYLTGFGVMFLRLVAGALQARAIVRRATCVDGMLVSAACASPVTVGWRRPRVVLPESWRSWPDAKLDAVLAHEREHVRRRDPLVQALAMLNRALFWFHPLAWRLERKLTALAEEACDAAVLERGHKPADYSEYLIEIARAVEQRGARVHALGVSIHGSTLAERIQQILASRPLPPLSRSRAAIAATLCLSLLAVFAACKPERAASKLAPGQPSMNELMHRRAKKNEEWQKKEQALKEAAKNLTPEQAQALIAQLKANPQDRETIIKLVRHYQYKADVQGLDALTLWYIEHQPDMPWAWNINPEWNREGYEQGKKLWLAHVKKPDAKANTYRAAARFLEGGDKLLGEEVLLAAQKAYPDEEWSTDLGAHYAQALLGSVGPLTEFNVIRSVNMKEAHGSYAQRVRAMLATSNDPKLLMQTSERLWRWGLSFLRGKAPGLDFDVLALVRSLNDRALTLQPDFPAALSQRFWLEEFETGERLRKTPPEQMNSSDRLRLLRRQVEEAGYRKKLEEVEPQARELLTLAAQNPTDREYGNAIFFGNLALSRVALRQGNKREAARLLLLASEAPPTDLLRYGHIDTDLPFELVDWGERDAVAQFLERCARFNRVEERMADWAAQIRKGINPDLAAPASK
jgi:hypothetical protein